MWNIVGTSGMKLRTGKISKRLAAIEKAGNDPLSIHLLRIQEISTREAKNHTWIHHCGRKPTPAELLMEFATEEFEPKYGKT